MEMQGLKPRILMGKLKQHLPPGVSLDNDLFLAMFLVRLPPSMRNSRSWQPHDSCGSWPPRASHRASAAFTMAVAVLWSPAPMCCGSSGQLPTKGMKQKVCRFPSEIGSRKSLRSCIKSEITQATEGFCAYLKK
jgi:hypothetical protein